MSKILGLVLDLDDTLFDTSMLLPDRRARKWGRVINDVDKTTIFPEAKVILDVANDAGLKVGIVTRSISNYANAILEYHGISPDVLVAYHDCSRQKPSPDPVLLCLHKLGLEPLSCIGIGDSRDDASAYSSAGVYAIGASWSPVFETSDRWEEVLTGEQVVALLENAVER